MTTALLEKPDVEEQDAQRVVDKTTEEEAGRLEYHWTVDVLYRALDAGVFKQPERLELIQGRIMEKMPQDPIHRAMRARLGRQLRLTYDTELVADVVAAYGEESDFDARHPLGQDTAVLIEVANTAMIYDLGEKAMQYAQSEVSEYWVVLVKESVIVRHRQPSLEGYQEVVQLNGEDALSPLALPEVVWTVNTLLGRTDK